MELDTLLLTATSNLIHNSISDKKLNKLYKTHEQKLHFVPFKYRVFGGILQSMNIQFGNYIEELIKILVKNSGYEILSISGKKSNNFKISLVIESQIDEYISKAQSIRNFDTSKEFIKLKNSILKDTDNNLISIKHDIDLLFRNKNNQIVYAEIKYNDDHDTGKFIDINRKFIKTYAYLVREFKEDIKPILLYFTNKRMKGNIYVPEETNIYRGKRFFDEYLNFSYDELENKLQTFANSAKNISKFDEIYKKIVKNNA